MINLNSLEIEGFGSVIQPIKYKIKNPGLNKIEGANGAGKTTITNALAWVGWGQLVKPKKSTIAPWPHIIDEHYQGTRVVLKFDDGKDKYKIIRCSEYKGKILGKKGGNRLIILKNGVELNEKLRDKKDYQKWIINKIGYSFELFKSTVLFTQELDNLMKEDGPSKKKIFDEAFETTFVNNAKKKVEERLLIQVTEKETLSHKIALAMGKVSGLKQSIQITKENIENFEKLKKERIVEVKSLIKELMGKKKDLKKKLRDEEPKIKRYHELDKELENFKELENTEFRLSMNVTGAQEKLETLRLEVKGLKDAYTNIKRNCSTCGAPLKSEKIIEIKKEIQRKLRIVNKQIEDNEKSVNDLTELYYTTKKDYNKLQKLKKEFDDLKVSNTINLNFRLSEIKERIEEEKTRLLKIEQEKPLPNKLNELTGELKQIRSSNTMLRNERKALNKLINVDKWLIKDPLSNSGLKAFIFDSMLGRVNNFLTSYTNIIGFGIKVFIDMNSANKDIRILIERGGDEVPYEDLSKGQKQLANVALAFSLSDAVQSIKPINCIFLDELFESLSAENIEKVGNIIMNKSKTKCVHLITHLTSFSPANCYTTYVELNTKKQTHLF